MRYPLAGAPRGLIARMNKRYGLRYVRLGISLYLDAVKYCNMSKQNTVVIVVSNLKL